MCSGVYSNIDCYFGPAVVFNSCHLDGPYTVERSTGNTQHDECIKTYVLQYAECQCVEKLSAHVFTLNQHKR